MPPLCTRLTPVLLAFVALGTLPAPGPAQVTRSDYAARRDALLAKVDSGVVVAFGGVEPVGYWPFFQLPAFHYLSGFDETDAAMVLVKRKGGVSATMFVPSRNAVQERWMGARTKAAEMMTTTGIDGRDIAELTPAIDSLAESGLPFYLISDVQAAENTTQDSLTRGRRFLSQVRMLRSNLEVLGSFLESLRPRPKAGKRRRLPS